MATDKNPMDIAACQTLQLMANALPNKERLCGGRPVKQVCAQADCRPLCSCGMAGVIAEVFSKGALPNQAPAQAL